MDFFILIFISTMNFLKMFIIFTAVRRIFIMLDIKSALLENGF
ncbi:hypothetical protein HMPREF0454_00908 [Hafnia alvei ATCC 51873]|uniref:Uncharacterized protein n=1 Tax=Hafnia alvei ATCC 51873 TaxID=1002364 RepID=G9Y2Y5_HAFAL|nr:hypothetical protein HMPREF0454_00908 [Hafnia alvei ATCC 51873]